MLRTLEADDILAVSAFYRLDHQELAAGTYQILIDFVFTQDRGELVALHALRYASRAVEAQSEDWLRLLYGVANLVQESTGHHGSQLVAEGALVHLAHVAGSERRLQVVVEGGVRRLLLRLVHGVVMSAGLLDSAVACLEKPT